MQTPTDAPQHPQLAGQGEGAGVRRYGPFGRTVSALAVVGVAAAIWFTWTPGDWADQMYSRVMATIALLALGLRYLAEAITGDRP